MSKQQPTFGKSITENKKVRRPSRKRYGNIQRKYDNLLEEVNQGKETIASLKKMITSRKTTIIKEKPNGKTEEIIVNLRPAQLVDLNKQLFDARINQKKLTNNLRRVSIDYGKVSKKTIDASRVKYTGMYEREKLALEADRNVDSIKNYSNEMFKKLAKSNKSLIAQLKTLALSDGRKFHLEFLKVLRSEVKDVKILSFIKASPKIQGVLSKAAREAFGYKKR